MLVAIHERAGGERREGLRNCDPRVGETHLQIRSSDLAFIAARKVLCVFAHEDASERLLSFVSACFAHARGTRQRPRAPSLSPGYLHSTRTWLAFSTPHVTVMRPNAFSSSSNSLAPTFSINKYKSESTTIPAKPLLLGQTRLNEVTKAPREARMELVKVAEPARDQPELAIARELHEQIVRTNE